MSDSTQGAAGLTTAAVACAAWVGASLLLGRSLPGGTVAAFAWLFPFFALAPVTAYVLQRRDARRAAAARAEAADLIARERDAAAHRTAAVAEDRAALLAAVARMEEGLLVIGNDGRVRFANELFRSICSLRLDPSGRPLAEVLRVPAVTEAVARALSGEGESRETFVEPGGAGRTFVLHVAPLGTSAGPVDGAVALIDDVTRLEALENVRRAFVSNVTHELRTPLTSIRGAVETLLDDAGAPPELSQRFLRIVRRQVERMEALVADLTDLSMIETGAIRLEPGPLDAAALAREVAAQFATARNGDVTIEVRVPQPFPLVADRRRLEQILVNLVDNAVKFNRPGGTVTIEGRAHEGHLELGVRDTGIGIPADCREKIFNRFFRVDPGSAAERGGTGLGLSIVKHLMRLHDGHVRVESELGVGSTFVLVLPQRST